MYTPWNEADIASAKKPSQKKRVFQLLNSYSQVLYVRFLQKNPNLDSLIFTFATPTSGFAAIGTQHSSSVLP